ncbi:probable F-box protein At4g22030 [Malania oleifera]|uniref:probable F-box protein At4g22030 n=1 Tax=Malania oleifera TaxID=397392 RepID=UPI0025AEC081|nr:probable F-box protein At4g22030 [Malania oleifera]
MAALHSNLFLSSSSSSSGFHREIKATLHHPKLQTPRTSFPIRASADHEPSTQNTTFPTLKTPTQIHEKPKIITSKRTPPKAALAQSNSVAVAQLHAIMEAVADRAEMHNNIGVQRDNWNRLLLTSLNGMTTTAAVMAGLAAVSGAQGVPLLALRISSALLYTAATGILVVMNKIQPSQLAEEQRNAARLFRQLQGQFQTAFALRASSVSSSDVDDAMEKVLALDRAYPLPLLGTMLDKFPKTVKPAVWWPQHLQRPKEEGLIEERGNGWSDKLEEEMREVFEVLRKKDGAEYVRLSKLVLQVNKVLALCSPLLTGLAAIGSGFASLSNGWAVGVGVVFGVLGTVVNALEHGGQVGMVFEMYRSSAGFFQLMEDNIEANLGEREGSRKENGEVFEIEVALQLGRSVSELRNLATSSSSSNNGKATEQFASKLF